MKKHLFLAAAAFMLLLSTVKAQTITGLQIIPQPATDNDVIGLVAYAMYPYSSCPVTNSSVNISGNSIDVYAYHSMGMMAAICNSTDTFTIGMLNPGTYQLMHFLTDPNFTNYYDTDTITFTVQSTTGIDAPGRGQVKIYPNPFTGSFVLEMDEQDAGSKLIVRDLLGREIRTVMLTGSKTIIEANGMSAGMYMYEIVNRNSIIGKGKLLVQ